MNAADLAVRVIAMYQQGDLSQLTDDELTAASQAINQEMSNRGIHADAFQIRLIDYRTVLDRAYKENGIEP